MQTKNFSKPERQSKIGILFIFLRTVYKLLRGFWVLAVYFILGDFSSGLTWYMVAGSILLGLAALIYSYLDYLKFQFHINYSAQEFVLSKGVFNTDNTAIPFSKIQQVYLEQSILQRIIGIKSVVVDTAGSKEKEIKIKALQQEKASQLKEILLNLVENIETETVTEKEFQTEEASAQSKKESEKEEEWTYRLSVGRLLKIGLTSNYLRGIGLLFFLYGTIQSEINQFAVDNEIVGDASEFMSNSTEIIFKSALYIFIGAILLFFAGLLITVVEVFIKYYNLKLTQTKTSLLLEMGLKTTKHIALKPKRVQLYRVLTNPIQKKLNLYEVQLAIAGSTDGLSKNKVKIPGLKQEFLKHIHRFIFDKPSENGTIYKPHKIWIFRKVVRFSIIPLLIITGLNFIFEFSEWHYIFLFGAVFLILVSVYQFFAYKKTYLSISPNFIRKNIGLWNQKQEVAEIFKLQGVSIKQPFWYKKRGLVNITLHTAGGDLHYRFISESVAKEINYILYKIETSTKAWM